MDTNQIDAVRRSFDALSPNADAVAELFYGRLFELDPPLRRLFKADLQGQRIQLMAMLAAGVHGLDRLDTLLPILQALGARHVGYGVRDEHYDSVGSALLGTLAVGLGEAFTPQLRGAWIEAYTLLAAAMKAGARQAGTAAGTAACAAA